MRHVLLRRHRPEPGRPLLSGHGLVLDDDRRQLCARTLFDLQLQLRILRHGIAQPDGCLFGHTEERFVGPVQPQLQPLAVPGIGVQQHQRRSVRVLEHPLRTYPPRKRVPARRPEIPGEVRREMDGHPHRRGAFLPRLRLLPALPRLWRGDSPHGGRWPRAERQGPLDRSRLLGFHHRGAEGPRSAASAGKQNGERRQLGRRQLRPRHAAGRLRTAEPRRPLRGALGRGRPGRARRGEVRRSARPDGLCQRLQRRPEEQ